MLFVSKEQMLLRRQALESEMSSYFYQLMELGLNVDKMKDRFDEMFPAEEKFFSELVEELNESEVG